MKVLSPNLVRRQILPYSGAAKITLFVKFMIVVIWIKFDTPIHNEMLITARK